MVAVAAVEVVGVAAVVVEGVRPCRRGPVRMRA